jgi:hypothetical protein
MFGEASWWIAQVSEDINPLELYLPSLGLGMATTALLAPLMVSKLPATSMPAPSMPLLEDQHDVCELINAPLASEMHQPAYTMDEHDEDWWVCPDLAMDSDPSCRPVYIDGEYKVACAF